MKSDRNFTPQMMPFSGMGGMTGMGNMPANMMMFPNYMNDNYSNLDSRVNSLEKKVRILENRISRIENPYQNTNTQNFPSQGSNMTTPAPTPAPNSGNTNQPCPYQTTQNSTGFNGEMYMM